MDGYLCLPRRSRRRAGHDYARPGVLYFVTFCTRLRRPLLGGAFDTGIQLSAAGRLVAEELGMLSRLCDCAVDRSVVMPDHVHLIVRTGSKPLGDVVRTLKSRSSRRVHVELGGAGPLWHRDYHDRVVRDGDELERIRRYVDENPKRWAEKKRAP